MDHLSPSVVETPAELRQEPISQSSDVPFLSIVVPIYNEEQSIHELHKQLTTHLQAMDVSYEIIAVDDGSKDQSFDMLKALAHTDPHVRVVQFRRNFGQTAAFSAGFDHARGAIIITIDADLQNDPADIPLLVSTMQEGYDVVSGWRKRRQDAFLNRRLPSIIANRVISTITGVHLHDYGCSLKAYRADVIKNIQLYGELHRFIPAIASWMGVAVAEIPVNHHPRRFGTSKYGINRTVRVVLDLMTVRFLLSQKTPIQSFGLIGLGSVGAGSAISLYLAILKIAAGEKLSQRPLLLLGVLLIILGAQFISMGLIGELVVRTYYETQHKRIYVVREILNHDT